jgi:alpha-tubulin suppressor-like RCC1 family protein
MIRGETRKTRLCPALHVSQMAVRVTVRAATAMAGLALTMAAAPALAAPQPGGTAASYNHPAITGQHTPTSRLSHGRRWAHIAPGGDHTCATRTNGTLWCWGYNGYGELGAGNQTNQDRPRQVTTPAPGGWASVTAGSSHTCATRTNGTLWCWGYNGNGELGVGNQTNQDRPQQVTTPAPGGWASVTAGYASTCAIRAIRGDRADRALWCWGDGQDRPQQVTIPAPGGWGGVTVGGGFTCATRTGGTLWCWGLNNVGQLGIGNQIDQDRPHQVTSPALGGWSSVSGGEDHTCATRTGGTLWCWGFAVYGQLGISNGSGGDFELAPRRVTIPAPGGWASVTAGYDHTCATRTGGTLWCWGLNLDGELGLGFFSEGIGPEAAVFWPHQVTTPVPGGWATVTVGEAHTCATRTGSLWCWGANGYGQLGIGNHTNQDRPRQVTGGAQLP